MNNSQFLVNRYSHLCIAFICLIGFSHLKAAAPEVLTVPATRVTYFEANLNARVTGIDSGQPGRLQYLRLG